MLFKWLAEPRARPFSPSLGSVHNILYTILLAKIIQAKQKNKFFSDFFQKKCFSA